MTAAGRAGTSVLSMRIDWDVPIEMDDGVVLRADVYRPDGDGPHPVLMTHGPYGKGLAFQEGYAGMWQVIEAKYPEILRGSSNRYQNWETVDPEKWVPDGYACVRVDSRGAGRSPGYLDPFSPRETQDYAACIEWAPATSTATSAATAASCTPSSPSGSRSRSRPSSTGLASAARSTPVPES